MRHKSCKKCGEIKALKEYHGHNQSKDGTINTCRDCTNQRIREWRGLRGRKRERFMFRLKKYGITKSQYEDLWDRQEGLCAICGCQEKDSIKGTFAIDHCHKTGQVRGLLCGLCNSAIGKLKDDPELLKRAAEYLEE